MSEESLKIRIAQHLPLMHRRILVAITSSQQLKSMNLEGVRGKKIGMKGLEYHRTRLKEYVNLHSEAELTKLALRLGLTEIDV